MMINKFNIRVYGICFNSKGELLVADERIRGRNITKLPGGGLEFGEGMLDCVRREFMEETGQSIRVESHFYTTDFFVSSVFNPSSQVICIYYKVSFEESVRFDGAVGKFDFPPGDADVLKLRWLPKNQVDPEEFTFPTDKKVAEMLQTVG